ncbi:MAG: ion channel [Alphaproteobacteria bacterium]
MTEARRHRFGAVFFTAALVLLIAFSVTEAFDYFLLVLLAVVIGAVVTFLIVFPGSLFFSLSFASLLGVYACLFTFLKLTNFAAVPRIDTFIGFALPVIGFVAGAVWHKREIRSIVTERRFRDVRHIGDVFGWLAPVFTLSALTFLVPDRHLSPGEEGIIFLGSMAIVSLVVLAGSRHVSIFLLDTGLLFEGFFQHIGRLFIPAFAFLTLYSLLTIVFACVYRILDRIEGGTLFQILGVPREITFPEALYFSIDTLSTVGYGDIVPITNLTRLITATEIVCGLLLLMFGVSELMTYARERRREGVRERG